MYAAMLVTGTALLVAARAHPIHTTATELTFDASTHTVQISMRIFADDFATAAARRVGGAPAADWVVPDSLAFAYATSVLSITDRGGARLSPAWCGTRREGDVVRLCLRAAAPAGLRGARLQNRALWEVHDDQINIVQATYDGRRQSLLFTKGDPVKPLP